MKSFAFVLGFAAATSVQVLDDEKATLTVDWSIEDGDFVMK